AGQAAPSANAGRQLLVGESSGLLRGPARGMKGAIDVYERQSDIIGDALLAQIIEQREALAVGPVEQRPCLPPLAKDDCERTAQKFRRTQHVVIGGADNPPGPLPPYQIAADDVGVQRPNKDAD